MKKPTAKIPFRDNSFLKILVISLAVMVGLAIVVGVGVRIWYSANLKPADPTNQTEQAFVIEPGSSTAEVGFELEQDDLIKSTTAFIWYVDRNSGSGSIQAGTYSLSPSLSVEQIVTKFINGEVDTSLFTILPGKSLAELKQSLIDFGFSASEVEQAFKASYASSVLEGKPAGASLEGYIFPETYQITKNSTPHSIIQHALDEFSSLIDNEIKSGIKKQGLSRHEAFILASIVQEEAKDPEEQAKIAQVFLKRLDDGMPLGADATFIYAAALKGIPADEATADIKSPYNTRIHAGLPPGPIANFELSALQAVANPADTNHLYFVHGDGCHDKHESTGCITYFASTLEEHESNVARYCREYCLGL